MTRSFLLVRHDRINEHSQEVAEAGA